MKGLLPRPANSAPGSWGGGGVQATPHPHLQTQVGEPLAFVLFSQPWGEPSLCSQVGWVLGPCSAGRAGAPGFVLRL